MNRAKEIWQELWYWFDENLIRPELEPDGSMIYYYEEEQEYPVPILDLYTIFFRGQDLSKIVDRIYTENIELKGGLREEERE